MISGPERTALLLLVVPSWWKGNLELLAAVATACLRIWETWGRLNPQTAGVEGCGVEQEKVP